MRGSSWAASATTSFQPASATTAERTCFGNCSAPPPPRLAHRPVTTPPGTNSGWNLPPEMFASSQLQPLAVSSRASRLYSSSGGIAGWSMRSSSQDRVDSVWMPARDNARSSSGGESGLRSGESSSRRRSRRANSIAAGRCPGAGRSPSASTSSCSCTSRRHGRPTCRISAATSAPADSAASSRPMRAASPEPAIAPRCRANSVTGSSACSATSKSAAGSADRTGVAMSQLSRGDCARAESAVSDEFLKIARHSRRSTHRSTLTPASRRGGYQEVVSSHTHRGRGLARGLPPRDLPREVADRERRGDCDARTVDLRQGDASGAAGEGEIHRPSLPCAPDIPRAAASRALRPPRHAPAQTTPRHLTSPDNATPPPAPGPMSPPRLRRRWCRKFRTTTDRCLLRPELPMPRVGRRVHCPEFPNPHDERRRAR